MTQNTSKTSRYHHLTNDDRDTIAYQLASGSSHNEIALEIGRHRSTIWREQRRNRSRLRDVRYLAHRAHLKAMERQMKAHERPRIPDVKARRYISRKIKQGYSPEQVAGIMIQEHPDIAVSHETIYQYIYTDNRGLMEYLRKRHKKRKKRGLAPGKHLLKIPNRTMIADRPKEVNERKTYGHWEADTIISRASRPSLQVIYERKSMYLKLKKIAAKTAPNMRRGLTRGLCRLPESMRRTITFDNGPENAEHEMVDLVLKTKSYFCNPYHSWEKGGIENVIGLIREYLPKRTNFAKIEDREIRRIERKLNNRPRKGLSYKTPAEVFRSAVALAA